MTGDADARLCAGKSSYSSGSFAICGRRIYEWVTPHWVTDGEEAPARQFLELSWQSEGATGGLHFSTPLDLSADRLELRTILDPSYDAPEIKVRISDSSGGSAVLDPVPGTEPVALPMVPFATKLWASTVVVDASGASGVDLTDITSVELVAGSPEGRVWIADVASAPAAPAPDQSQRLAQVRMGDLQVDEGSGGRKLVRVPFTIVGDVTRPAQFAAFTAGQERGQIQRLVIDVAPGQTTGYIPVEYEADDSFGFNQETQIAIWPMRGIATDDYLGGLTVIDDDPVPTIDVDIPHRVREGQPIKLTVAVHGESSVPFYAFGLAVRGKGEDLRGTDVPAGWLEQHGDASHPHWALWRLYASVQGEIRPRKGSITLTIPTRKDGVSEGPEFLYLKLDVGELHRQRYRIKVTD